MLRSAKDVVASGDAAAVVDYAIEANRQIVQLQAELDILKDALRKRGMNEAAMTGETSISVGGRLGTAQIVLVRPQPRARKGVDLLASEAGLPPEVFNALFVKRTVVDLAPDFIEKVSKLPRGLQTVITNLVETVASTPRVSLPK